MWDDPEFQEMQKRLKENPNSFKDPKDIPVWKPDPNLTKI